MSFPDLSLPSPTDKFNIGSLSSIKFVTTAEVESARIPVSMPGKAEVTLKSGCVWQTVDFIEQSARVNVNRRKRGGGELSDITVNATIAKTREELLTNLRLLGGEAFLLRVVDQNGLELLLGSVSQGLRLRLGTDSGGAYRARNHVTLSWQGATDHLPLAFHEAS